MKINKYCNWWRTVYAHPVPNKGGAGYVAKVKYIWWPFSFELRPFEYIAPDTIEKLLVYVDCYYSGI